MALALAGCGSAQSRTAAGQGLPGSSPVASLQDDRIYQPGVDVTGRMRTMADLGAAVVRVDLRWDLVARSRPADPRDPADPAYDWSAYDRIVSAARATGVRILFTVWGTPDWARDPAVPVGSRFGPYAVRPLRPGEFGSFGAAAAARYAPLGVHLWEAWNEPNIPLFLRPQFERRGGRWVSVAPALYSSLLRSFYRNVKRGDPRAKIAGAVTAPVGDQCPSSCPRSPDARTTALGFLAGLAAPGRRPPMDFYSHHPYPITTPRDTSFTGASYIDLYNLDRLERALDRTYLRGKRLWLTEFGFGTRRVREYPFHVTPARQADFLLDAYRRVRQDGRVKLFTWYFLQDSPFWSSGLLDQRGRRKPAFAAYSLPVAALTAAPAPRGAAVRVVGQVRAARGATRVALQRRDRGGWRRLRLVRTARDGSFSLVLRPRGTASYRARWSGVTRSGARVARVSPTFVLRVR
ncbi:MAG: hypothetical protein QOK40_2289 [Miltoncostaeaceae bacterium]|nr:hypothetical protein [Miltoncostaeaceae bacterium]